MLRHPPTVASGPQPSRSRPARSPRIADAGLATRLATAAAALAAALLTACGSGSSTSADSGSSTGTGTDTSTATPAQLMGVAAYGAPLVGARVRVIDADGTAVGSATTNQADGSYSLTLSTAAPKLPLMVQAVGFDASGHPLVLHSALAAISAAPVVNITPLTDAVIALTLGMEPRKVFAQPSTYATALASLARLTPGSDFVKALIKNNLTDAKTTSATTLDLFSENTFSASKVGVDLALETLSISLGTSALRQDQLQLANKLGSRQIEVTVDLAKAAIELAKTTGAAPTTAITSTLKVTTSPTATVTKLPALDVLAAAINSAIAAGGTGTLTTALAARYTRHDGRDATALKALVADWASRNMQMGRFQVTGCADDPVAGGAVTTNCTKVTVAARLNDAAGQQAGSFQDVASYRETDTPKWSLVGNGQLAQAAVSAVALLEVDSSGVRPTGTAANPQMGLRLDVQNSVSSAKVQTPSNYVLSLVPCDTAWLCIAPTQGATSTLASGMPGDQSVFQAANLWLGGADLATAARFTFTLTSGATVVSHAVGLSSGLAAAPADTRFVSFDGVGVDQPLSGAALLSGTRLSWEKWADANPDMRVTTMRLVLPGPTATDAAAIFDFTPETWQAREVAWNALTLPDGFNVGAITLWVTAIDAGGRQLLTRYDVVPAP